MTVRKISICMILLLIMVPSFVGAQQARNGSAAASYILVPQGIRYLSGGGAAASVDGLESVFWNPAGLSRSEKPVNAMFARRNYIADININFVGLSLAWENFGSLAFTLRNFDIGEIPVTTVFAPDGTGEKFEPSIFVAGVTYSRLLTDRTSVGVNANFLSEGFSGVNASGLAFDVGIQYNTFMDIQNLSIGVVLKNFGSSMQYSGSRLWRQAVATDTDRIVTWYKVEAAKFDLPSTIDMGTSYKMEMGESNSVELGITFKQNQSADNEIQYSAVYNVGDLLAVRGAFMTTSGDGDLENPFASFAVGGTLNLQAYTGVDMSLDYGFIDTEFFDSNQVFSLRFGF